MEDLKNNRYISCSQRVVRDKDEVGIADIEYFIGSVEKYAYERLMLGDEDEILLNSFGSLNGDDVVQKIIESEQKEKDRKKYIEGLIKFGNGTTIENRNRRFIDLVAEGLTLGETIGACSTFVNSLPDSMDPTNCAFIPGEVFFKQPIDLHQLNHRAYSDDNHRTVFGGMITWSNTIKSAQVIALCVIFQKMLLSGRNNYTSSEIISIMKEYQLLKSISENYTQKYREYLNKRNDLLRDIAKKMVEKFNFLRGKSGSEIIFIIKDVYKEIERARGKFSLSMDMKMYLGTQDPSNKISSTVNFGAIAEIGRVKLALDSIYYKNGVSLNSKKLCMIQVATNLIHSRKKAIALVEENYKFDIRNVDISDGYAVPKRRFPRQKIFSKK